MKKFFAYVFAFTVMFVFCGCARETLVAYIKDGTSAGSDNYTININFAEDSKFKDKSIDVLVKSNIENLTLTFKREFDEDTHLFLAQKDSWYSLTQLINVATPEDEKEDYMPFSEKSNMTLVIKSEQDAVLTMRVVCGDEIENSEEEKILVNKVNVSKEFNLDLGRNHK